MKLGNSNLNISRATLTSIKKIWSGIRKIVNTRQSSSRFISQISVDGKDFKDPKQIANAFNNFFVNVDNTVNKDIPLTFKSPSDYLKNPNPQSLFLYRVTKLEIEEIIDSLNSSKASGPFSIPIKLLKLLRSIVSDPICLLINDSFLTGQFPDKLKLAKTMPLNKKGSTLNMNNYRPISLLSIFSKISAWFSGPFVFLLDELHHTKYLLAVKPFAERQKMPWG